MDTSYEVAVGRVVLYKTADSHLPAIITKVHDDTLVNLHVFRDGEDTPDQAPERYEVRVQRGQNPGQWFVYTDSDYGVAEETVAEEAVVEEVEVEDDVDDDEGEVIDETAEAEDEDSDLEDTGEIDI
jgi:hypothetical protein